MEVELTRISEKGQVVIPAVLRRGMKINKSDKFLVFGEKDTIILKRIENPDFKRSFDEIANPLQKEAKRIGLTKKDLKRTIRNVRNA